MLLPSGLRPAARRQHECRFSRMFAYFRATVPWHELARRTVRDTLEDGCPGLAAQLAFYFLLSLFPALLFLVSLLSYLPVHGALLETIAQLDTVMPAEVLRLVRSEIERVLEGNNGGLLTLGVAGALWSSSAAFNAIISALNTAYDVREWRPWWKRRLIAIGLTVALAVFVVVAFGLIVGGADLAGWIAEQANAGDAFATTWAILHWPVAFALIVLAVDLVYYFAPNVESDWVWVTPGSLLATTLWLIASYGFRLYAQNFSTYDAVYGAIGSVIVLMLWFYISGLTLLVGAELNAEIDKALPLPEEARERDGRRAIGPAAERNARGER
jgi:membrane protein